MVSLLAEETLNAMLDAEADQLCGVKRYERNEKRVNGRAGHYGMIKVRAKTIDGEFWEPKTKKNRAVPISSSLRAYLDNYSPRPSKGRWYFPSPKAFNRYDVDNFSRDLRKENKKAGLKWSCLDFRHTFGSQLAMKGESLYKTSTLMGNSPEICRRHYAALVPEAMTDSVEFVEIFNHGGELFKRN